MSGKWPDNKSSYLTGYPALTFAKFRVRLSVTAQWFPL